MTTNQSCAAQIINAAHIEAARRLKFPNPRALAQALADAGLLAPELPNFSDQELVGVDDYGHIFIRYSVDDQWLTKRDARDLALSLLAAADHAEGVGRADA